MFGLDLDIVHEIVTLVRQTISGDDQRSRVELVKFSGKDDDVIREDASKVYLRCMSERMRDGDGNPVEFIARLASVGSFWHIPDYACELVAVVPEDAARAVGAAFVLPMSVTPPKKLAAGFKAFWSLGAASLLVACAGFMFKTKTGATMGLKDDGGFLLSWPNGTRIECDSSALRFVVCDNVGVATSMILDASGWYVRTAPNGLPTLTLSVDGLTGTFEGKGIGFFVAKFPFGRLGALATVPIAYPSAGVPAPSVTWSMSP
jgi:hypothetical protein